MQNRRQRTCLELLYLLTEHKSNIKKKEKQIGPGAGGAASGRAGGNVHIINDVQRRGLSFLTPPCCNAIKSYQL